MPKVMKQSLASPSHDKRVNPAAVHIRQFYVQECEINLAIKGLGKFNGLFWSSRNPPAGEIMCVRRALHRGWQAVEYNYKAPAWLCRTMIPLNHLMSTTKIIRLMSFIN